MKKLVVTIDGPAGAGKSTVAKTLARRLGYSLLDTGAIYRSVALSSQRAGIPWDDAERLAQIARDLAIEFKFVGDTNSVFLAGEDVSKAIRTPEISQGASQVSAHGPVRAALLDLQRRLGSGGGVVVEGRDTGTVVFPLAEAKFFLSATDEERARRRVAELQLAGKDVDYIQTLAEIRERDHRDASRDVAPMKAAEDAVIIDSSTMTIDQVVDAMADRCS
ncbi:MAG: (d)CMP kinase [Kofleriaceae bacterium]